jgi:hypothetical protein
VLVWVIDNFGFLDEADLVQVGGNEATIAES